MKAKYIVAYGLSALLSLTAVSCKKSLEIEPKQNIDAKNALENIDDVRSAVVGMYGIMGGGALYGNNLNLLSELQGSEGYLSWRGTFQSFRQVANKNITADNADITRTWTNAYQAINLSNNILAAIEKIDPSNTEYKGEALFVRGAMLFELVRFYALPYVAGTSNTQLGVPIVLTPATDEASASVKQSRNTVEEVYAQVIKDLTDASNLMLDAAPNISNDYRATKYTALSFLARVYLQKAGTAGAGNADLIKARDLANQVIESGYFKLQPNVTIPFRNKNSNPGENIFEIQQNDQNNAGTSNDGLTTFYSSQKGNIGRGDVRILDGFSNSFATNDARKTELIYEGKGARPGFLYSGKWTTFGQNIPIVRLAELYLVRAEANLRLGTAVGDLPANDLNKVRARAGVAPIVLPVLADILQERRWELAFEGLRIHDIKRQKLSTGTFAYNDPLLVFPIPDREIKANSNLVQNPGY